MIAFAGMLVDAAEKAGIKVPPNPDDFEREDFMHFFVFSTVQLGAPMPWPGAHWDNAQMIAQISDEEIRQITYQELLDRGLAVGGPVS
jgi:hypothetical protein